MFVKNVSEVKMKRFPNNLFFEMNQNVFQKTSYCKPLDELNYERASNSIIQFSEF